jgi:hypothetical protein
MSRPLISCGGCDYTWHPRGHDFPSRCPRCNARLTVTAARSTSRTGCGTATIAVIGVFLILAVFGSIMSLLVPRQERTDKGPPDTNTAKNDQPIEKKSDPDKEREPAPPVPQPGSQLALLDPPNVEPIVEPPFFDRDRFEVGQVGTFRPFRGGAQHATVVAVLDKQSMVVRVYDRDVILSGVRTETHSPDKAIFLRGTWEVLGRKNYRSNDRFELAHLIDASEAEAPPAPSTSKPPSTTIEPIFPTQAQIEARSGDVQVRGQPTKGGPVQVRSYVRSDGTPVRAHTRAAPGGGKR